MRYRGAQGPPLRIAAVAVLGVAVMAATAKAQNVGVFVSSTTTNGNIGGLSGGDAICQGLGTAAFPGSGPWVAWLSTDDPPANARDRIPTPGAGGDYVRASQPGTVIADDLADLTDSSLTSSVLLTESGDDVGGGADVWTGTDAAGFATGANQTCAEWTQEAQAQLGVGGFADGTDIAWTQAGAFECSEEEIRVYCYGPIPPPAPALPLPALLALALLLLVGGAYLYRRRQLAA